MEELEYKQKLYLAIGISFGIYLIGGYFLAILSNQSGFAFFVTFIGFGLMGGFFVGQSVVERKNRTLLFGLFFAILGVAAGILVGHIEKAVEWGLLSLILGNTVGLASYNGWKGIIIGSSIGLAFSILAGNDVSIDELKIENEMLNVTFSILSGMLMGGFWGGLFQMSFKNRKG